MIKHFYFLKYITKVSYIAKDNNWLLLISTLFTTIWQSQIEAKKKKKWPLRTKTVNCFTLQVQYSTSCRFQILIWKCNASNKNTNDWIQMKLVSKVNYFHVKVAVQQFCISKYTIMQMNPLKTKSVIYVFLNRIFFFASALNSPLLIKLSVAYLFKMIIFYDLVPQSSFLTARK